MAAVDTGAKFAVRILDVLDCAVLGVSVDLRTVLYLNSRARALLDQRLLPQLKEAIGAFLLQRTNARQSLPVVRVALGGREAYLCAQRVPGDPPMEVVFVRELVPWGVQLFRLLNERYRVTRRGYQVLAGLRLGKTNRQIAEELGLTPGTVSQLVHNLLGRFQVPNRTSLVNLVEQMATGAK